MEQLVSLDRKKIYNDLWSLSWPVMAFMVFQTTLELVDLYWVGRLGTPAIAALSLSNSLFWMLFSFTELITVSTVALTSRYRGARDFEGVKVIVRHSFWLALLIALVIIVFIYGLGERFISFFQVEEEIRHMALLYLKVTGIGFIFVYGAMSMGASLQGVGDTRTPMIILIITNIINIILDPIMIFGLLGFPALGILGAALATLISRAIGFSVMLYILISGKITPSRLKVANLLNMGFESCYFKRIFQIGLPAALQSSTRPITGMIMMWIVALFGTAAVAAFGIGLRILGLAFIMISGLMAGTSTMVGQSMGANLKNLTREITRKAMTIGISIQATMAFLSFFGAPLIIKLFTGDVAVIEAGVSYLQIIAPGLLLLGPFTVIEAVFKGSGHTMPPMVSAMIANWIIKIPCAYLLAMVIGTNGVWWAITISIVAELLFLLFWFRRGHWLYKEIRVTSSN